MYNIHIIVYILQLIATSLIYDFFFLHFAILTVYILHLFFVSARNKVNCMFISHYSDVPSQKCKSIYCSLTFTSHNSVLISQNCQENNQKYEIKRIFFQECYLQRHKLEFQKIPLSAPCFALQACLLLQNPVRKLTISTFET